MQVYICLRCDNSVDKKKDFVEDMRVKRKQGQQKHQWMLKSLGGRQINSEGGDILCWLACEEERRKKQGLVSSYWAGFVYQALVATYLRSDSAIAEFNLSNRNRLYKAIQNRICKPVGPASPVQADPRANGPFGPGSLGRMALSCPALAEPGNCPSTL